MPGYNFDPNKFIYIGAANKENSVLVFSKRSGFTSVDKWRNSPVPAKLGGLVPGNNMDNTTRVIKDVLGFPTQLVTGYKGTADVMIAMDNGELAGGDVSWDSVKTGRKSQLASGESIVLMQAVSKPLKDLPNVPRVIDFAKTEEQKKLVEIVIHLENEFSRTFVVPPGTPKDRVEILRKAFQETTRDPELIAEVNKMGLTLEPTSAEDLTSSVAKIGNVDAATKAKLKDMLLK
jgi:tripartite-type tricarboxylate transporter receptor subunit TctC